MAKFKDLSGKYKTCGEAIETCTMGGWCTSCMYAYPGNGIIDGKPESYVDVCTMSKKQAQAAFDHLIPGAPGTKGLRFLCAGNLCFIFCRNAEGKRGIYGYHQ